nr:N-(5-amino-5-carboxypentanoyl)-L-cysteinyl-D-valine synthase [Tanacetum cinerariifolium]
MSSLMRSSSFRLIRIANQNQRLRSLRQFSTESSPPPSNESAAKPIFESPSAGFLYGKLVGITNNTLKSDVLSLLEECNLTTDDLKVDYNPAYSPTGMLVQFSSKSAYDAALRAVTRKGRLYRLERADRANWDYVQPYGGKFVKNVKTSIGQYSQSCL